MIKEKLPDIVLFNIESTILFKNQKKKKEPVSFKFFTSSRLTVF